MREAGVNLVAINVFGWSHVEPHRGEYDFTALDRVIELLHRSGHRPSTSVPGPPRPRRG